jgi:HNH endonuclease
MGAEQAVLDLLALVRPGFQEIALRILSRVEANAEGCWLWPGALTNGYGAVSYKQRPMRMVHRIVYEALVADIPRGMVIDHLCLETRCCRPSHLEPVSVAENWRRGTGTTSRWKLTECHKGHPFTDDNTYVKPNGTRNCKACRRDALRRLRAATALLAVAT